MRKTKIVCTIGPACNNEETLRRMCLAGMNVARLNFSHGTHEEHLKTINLIKKVRSELDLPIAILLDTKGPEFRIKTFKDGKITLNDNDKFTFTTDDVVGDQTRVSVSYKGLPADMAPGDRILLNNGLVIFTVESVTDTDINCRVDVGGIGKLGGSRRSLPRRGSAVRGAGSERFGDLRRPNRRRFLRRRTPRR